MVVGSPTKLNLIPSGVMPVVYINQGDAGYDKEFLIYNGDSPYNVPAGVSATIRGKKADGYGVTEAAALTEGSNLVTVTITEQMVAAEGANLYELVFVDTDGLRIATINMVWAVKKDALGDSVISDSDLDYASQVMDQLQSASALKNQVDANAVRIATETERRTAADDAERAARIAADSTLQTHIDSEAAVRATTDLSLQNQINQLVAPTGSAPSAAEVQDARIGANGVTYSTLGMAIRTQIENVKDPMTYDYYTDEVSWALGYWAFLSGAYVQSTTWACSKRFVPNSVTDIEMTSTAYKLYVLAYDEAETYKGTWNGSQFTTTDVIGYTQRYYDMAYFRETYPDYVFKLNITAVNGSALTLATIAGYTLMTESIVIRNNNDIQDVFGNIMDPKRWSSGTITAGVDDILGANIRLSSNGYFHFIAPVTMKAKPGYGFSVITYSSEKVFETQFTQWCTTSFTFNRTDKYYKIIIRENNDARVRPRLIADYIETEVMINNKPDRTLAEFATVKAVNHRGYNSIAPENTIPAYKMSAAFGFKYVETDVLFTSDGVPVLLHDATINRTARNSDGTAISGTVNIADITYAEALGYDFGIYKGAQYAGTKIPTFEEFMRCCKALNLHPWIELKNEKTYTQAEIQLIISIIKRCGMEEHVTFISFSAVALTLVKNEWDSVELGLNGTVSDALALKTGKNRVFMIYDSTNANYTAALDAGFQICFYIINLVSQILSLSTYGYDSLLTDSLFQSQVSDTVRDKFLDT